MALNLICCETAIPLESEAKPTCPPGAQNVADDPSRTSADTGQLRPSAATRRRRRSALRYWRGPPPKNAKPSRALITRRVANNV